MSTYAGAAVVHGNTAYFSQLNDVYSYTLASGEWTRLPPCEYNSFGLAVVNNKVTTIGGMSGKLTNVLLCLEDQGTKWRELLPPMPTARIRPATVTTSTYSYLIVAGGRTRLTSLSNVEILDTNILQWSSASSSPKALGYPHITLCGEHLYLSEDNTIFSCSVEELLKSCKPASTNSSDGASVWTKLSNIPVSYEASLITLRGQVLAIGGSDQKYGCGTPTEVIHRYNKSTNSWSAIGEMPTPRSDTLVAVLPSNELIAVGGQDETGFCDITEIASTATRQPL